ncbi:MAG: Ig-like domain-containing protein [Bacteroidales bacterium]|nr:Ig-like domain-containing protein [Bacteroidales bacterium]
MTDIKLSQSGPIEIDMGQTLKLLATAEPEGCSVSFFEWASADPNVAAVAADGTITGVGTGTTDITVTAAGFTKKISVTVYDPNYNIDDFFAEVAGRTKKTFTGTGDVAQTVDANGFTFQIPAGAFTQNGVPVTGPYTLEIETFSKPSDIILAGTNTNYHGGYGKDYMISDGFFNFTVLVNGQPVDQNFASWITATVPTDKDDWTQTEIWYNSGAEGDEFEWTDVTDVDTGAINQDRKGSQAWANNGGFTFSFDKAGLYNCDILWSLAQTNGAITYSVTFTGKTTSPDDILLYFKVEGVLSVAEFYNITADKKGLMSYEQSIPSGVTAKLLAMAVKGGKYYYATKTVTTGTTDTFDSLEMIQTTKAELLKQIEALDNY